MCVNIFPKTSKTVPIPLPPTQLATAIPTGQPATFNTRLINDGYSCGFELEDLLLAHKLITQQIWSFYQQQYQIM